MTIFIMAGTDLRRWRKRGGLRIVCEGDGFFVIAGPLAFFFSLLPRTAFFCWLFSKVNVLYPASIIGHVLYRTRPLHTHTHTHTHTITFIIIGHITLKIKFRKEKQKKIIFFFFIFVFEICLFEMNPRN